MHELEKRDWKTFLYPLAFILGTFIVVAVYLSTIPADLGPMGLFNIPKSTWIGVFIPFIISCFAPIVIALLVQKAISGEEVIMENILHKPNGNS